MRTIVSSKSCIAHYFFRPDTYYLAFPSKDPLHLRIQVYGVLIWEFAQTAVVAHDVIVALAPTSGDPQMALDSLFTYWFSIPVCGGISEYMIFPHEI